MIKANHAELNFYTSGNKTEQLTKEVYPSVRVPVAQKSMYILITEMQTK